MFESGILIGYVTITVKTCFSKLFQNSKHSSCTYRFSLDGSVEIALFGWSNLTDWFLQLFQVLWYKHSKTHLIYLH